ncbi:hypothetical protein GXP71_00665 [Cellulomonas sp. H30R-01]|uniref:hypothetical protein n=1 Tax=Cellulomonas sp. H30R-01 TaxID=2704467 RepID=UPI00138B5ACD|nr:hypothetical protein [Cellulomonas sp. H30R-01]QHT54754.1 hypothetical protein GXP71_00665 [Cellulomonas sp. H30R-01]
MAGTSSEPEQQPHLGAVTWAPLHDRASALRSVRWWSAAGGAGFAVAASVAVVVAGTSADRALAMYGIGAAVAVGALLVGVGVGLLTAEAVRSDAFAVPPVPHTPPDPDKPQSAVGGMLPAGATLEQLGTFLGTVRQVLAGLSPGRICTMLGTLLLVVGAATAVAASNLLGA